jgi:ABC-type bacteriocin/lantibiotic exporter with double-glycine peptidase domain
MVLSYHGRATRLDECRESCGVGRDGLSTRTIAEVGRRFGLRMRGFSLEPAALRHVPLPAIAHWNFNHFVIIESWTPTKVDIVDPGTGRQQVSAAEFEAAFTGVLLTCEPSVAFEARPAANRPGWHGVLAYLLRTPGIGNAAVRIMLASLLLQLLGLALPLLTGVVVDRVVGAGASDLILALSLGCAAVFAAVAGFSYARAATLVYLRSHLDAQLMLGFCEHLLGLPFRFFEGRKTGQLMARVASNVVVRETLTNQTVAALLDGGLVLVYLSVLLVRAPAFGLLVLAFAALQVGAVVFTSPAMQRLVGRELTAQAESQGYLVEALRGISLLKASGSEPRVLAQWANLFATQTNLALERGRISTVIETVVTTSRMCLPLLLLLIGAHWVMDGSISLGTMLGLNALAATMLVPLGSVLANGQQLQLVGSHTQRILDVLETAPEQSPVPARTTPQLTGRLEVRNLSFRHAPTSPLALRDVSFSVKPGQKIALVGRSGSGKSTLAALLLGLYPLAEGTGEGSILYDGVSLADLELHALRSQIGVVLQDPFVFSSTIRQNVGFHDPTLPLDDIVAAARAAGVHDDIVLMPLGYDTVIAEGGATLSGGQRQRLQLARALARQPRVLLLDEATSHLDAVTERQVDANLSALSCTRIVIAHRLSTIQNADQILVFENGAIVERGTHAELLALHGHYAQLAAGQLEASPDDAQEVAA